MLGVALYIVFSCGVGLFWAGYEYRALSFRGLSEWALCREAVLIGLFLATVWPLAMIAAVFDWQRGGK